MSVWRDGYSPYDDLWESPNGEQHESSIQNEQPENEPMEDANSNASDEFLIQASCHPFESNRQWTRTKFQMARHLADQAVIHLGFHKAVVINIFDKINSDPLYEVKK